MNPFLYDNVTCQLELNEHELLLIKEFADLMDPERNKSPLDPSGLYKLRAFREFSYIYLAISWKSPYADYEQGERHDAALKDAKITESEWNNPEFRAACRKFKAMQEENRSLRLLESARTAVDKLVYYFKNLDPEERDPLTGKPVFKVKDVIGELTSLNKVQESLAILENQVKKEISQATNVRAGAVDGYHPNF